jgi:hypothetical protein
MTSAVKFDPEKLIPGLAEGRRQERENRALAFAGITHTACGREILPLTPRHRLQLQLVRNAFAVMGELPTLVDVFVFLWVLSPHNRGAGIEASRQQYFLREDVAAMDLFACVQEIYRYIVDQLQDTFCEIGGEGRDKSAWIHWAAMDSAFYITEYNFSLEEYMRTPFLVLQQLFRAWKVNHPDVEYTKEGKAITRDPVFRNSSDRLLSDFHRENAERIKAWHLSQKHKRN